MARIGGASGSLGGRESQFVHNLILPHVMKAWDIMAPRPVVFELPESTRLVDFVQLIEGGPFARIPVFNSNRGEVVGPLLNRGNPGRVVAVRRKPGRAPPAAGQNPIPP